MNKKIGLGLAVIRNQDLKFYVLNKTPYRTLVALYLQDKETLKKLYSGELAPKEYDRLPFDFNPQYKYKFRIGYLYLPSSTKDLPSYQKCDFHFSAKKLKQNCFSLPVLNQVGWLFSLHKPAPELDVESMLQNPLQSQPPPAKLQYPFEKPPEVIDLHIEKIAKNYKKVAPNSIKEIQIETFKQKLSEAIAYNMPYITFIHGVGNQVLSQIIHTYLKSHKDVKDFSKCDFNSGLTQVELRQI